MASLPLFPLNTVLFPGMRLKLHIFEERYKLMINSCIDANQPFGVVLIKRGREALGPMATPHAVGCQAAIQEVERLPLGRMNITAIGLKPFRILRIEDSQPYLLADVETFLPAGDKPDLIRRCSGMLRPLIMRYLEVLSSSNVASPALRQIPHQPRAIALIASILLQADNERKQELLEMQSLSLLLQSLVDIYRLETRFLQIRLSPPADDFDIGPFSSN